jgi:serine/threonine-protein kinase
VRAQRCLSAKVDLPRHGWWCVRRGGRIVVHKVEPVSTKTQVEIGSDFLGYRIEELVGRGGMGVVYRAYDLRLKRTVALKLVTPELALDERFKERFARETELTMALEHPNVVPIHDAGDVDGRLYLAMRLVEGTDLRALLATEGPLEPARALAICAQVANALDAAHARGLVHRDVKPSNVLLDANEHVYLADFGLTRRLEEQGAQAGEGRSVGTPAYLAPEQIEGKPIDGRADVYSLGCMLSECLTGSAPFPRSSRLAAAWAHLEEEPPRVSELDSGLPQALDDVIRKALDKEPDQRYPTCAALIAAAGDALGVRDERSRSRRVLVLALALVGILAAALVTALVSRGSGPPPAPEVRANTLVRIDPQTSALREVIDVGQDPMATAAGGDSVWVYNRLDESVSEIDAESSEVRRTTAVAAKPVDFGFLTGPVIAADEDGAWIIGLDGRGRPVVTNVRSGEDVPRNYLLELKPSAVAVFDGAVWILGESERRSQLLRRDAASGAVTARTRFPASIPVSSLTAGLGYVWAVSSSRAILYRIHARSATLSGRVELLAQRAGRPYLEFGYVFVALAPSGSLVLDPRTLTRVVWQGCCPLNRGYEEVAAHGSTWVPDPPTGTVHRFDFNSATGYSIDEAIAVTPPPRFSGGPCLTSVAATAEAVWVTLSHSSDGRCPR